MTPALFGAVQMFFLGLLGEYIGAIQTQVRKLPLVVQAERINFDGSHVEAADLHSTHPTTAS